jgi:hypothetical protein
MAKNVGVDIDDNVMLPKALVLPLEYWTMVVFRNLSRSGDESVEFSSERRGVTT